VRQDHYRDRVIVVRSHRYNGDMYSEQDKASGYDPNPPRSAIIIDRTVYWGGAAVAVMQ